IHHSRFMPLVDPLIHNHFQFSSSSSETHLTSQDQEDKENEGDDPIHPFQDDENGNEETEADLDPKLEPTWEAEQEPASILQEYDEQDTSIDTGVDGDGDVSMQDGKSLLRHLPAHREEFHIEQLGGQAGAIIVEHGKEQTLPIFHDSKDGFLHYEVHIPGITENKWAPFASRMDWEIARWAKLRGTGSTHSRNCLLLMMYVSEALQLSYKNSDQLNSIIETKLPAQRPAFVRQEVVIAGEALDLYKQPVMECIQALYGSPEHAHYLCLTPEWHYSDANKTNRLYHDMYTGKWWWTTLQKQLEKDKPGATIVPVILSSDKTQITLFRNKSAYPVYLTIGNLPKEIRRKPSQQ
ncbi:hypothetical protein F5879DRAFT_983267, partial [Lentinula edodes]